MAVPGRKRGRFSVFYFGLIYIYTLLFDFFECIPFLESVLRHLPQPRDLVSDTYQPISDKAPAEADYSTRARSSSLLRHAAAANALSPDSTEQDAGVAALRRRRASSVASSSTTSSHGLLNASMHSEDIDAGFVYSPASTISTPTVPSSAAKSGAAARGLKKKTLVLDLDETLIHSSPQGSYRAHHRIEVVIDKVACLYYVYKRPHVDYFLRKVSEWYTVVVFTASLAEYADPVIDLLDVQGKYIAGRYFRESCIPHDSSYAKNLAAINQDLSQVVLVDNSPLSYFINPTNGIPIQPWINSDPKDEALLDLLPLLDALRFTDDVRSVLSLRLV
ncbi:Nuclear envelope morphology protein 1 [Coemansia sp. RSA 2611]|nr:Nuclear envelope morphology protein 1 [Coemansia sp. RSA 2702]KAJ2364943.1 Nuclear envelope morphology protein 1 [Coemansia sp. RSA 2610]KAJ2388836.1 Nuclear envelope morphology protein 1 [Coemansia sp. RSA 2611]